MQTLIAKNAEIGAANMLREGKMHRAKQAEILSKGILALSCVPMQRQMQSRTQNKFKIRSLGRTVFNCNQERAE